jgi:hypothetical protein
MSHLITAPLDTKIVTRHRGGVQQHIAWCAFREGDVVDAPCGYGSTEDEAKADLRALERCAQVERARAAITKARSRDAAIKKDSQ